MPDPLPLMGLALAAFLLPGALAFWAGRRNGIGILWAAMIAIAVICIAGWIVTRQPLYGEAAVSRSIAIYFALLPGFVGLVLGAAMGALAGRR